MYGINGIRFTDAEEILAALADTRTDADDLADRARALGWRQVVVIPAVDNTCHSPLGASPGTPVCALRRGHTDEWHQVSSGAVKWRDDRPSWLRHSLEEQRKRDTPTQALATSTVDIAAADARSSLN
ncbi:hypothetical protein NQK81_01360 [Amycolatopsis roodepoortensis]|uniref:hypothetical protein n=1 Tax=Amycolatopsis roodepoortensis TaxID=700274 RepID=UPI00214C62A5|nr:hypothetical protein [Amycolatopsis roodepoortensis]UUV32123.1 hypothetical protein NQK81_01360 [Amycolatopsis roodepoortensis]